MKFTQTNVHNLKPSSDGDVTIWDDAMTGFGIRFRNGGEGVYTIKFSVNGRQSKLGLGKVSQVSLDDARIEARKHFLTVSQGNNPHIERAREDARKGANFAAKIEDYLAYLASKDLTADYIKRVDVCLRRRMTKLHDFGINEIEKVQVAEEINKIKKASGNRAAGLARSHIHGFFVWALAQGLAQANPAMGTERNPSKFRNRVLSPDELVAIWNETPLHSDYNRIIRLLMLTAARMRQIGKLRWSEVKTADRIIDLPAIAGRSKNKERFLIALSDQALAILDSIPRRLGCDFVFGDTKTGFEGYSTGKERLDLRLGEMAPWVHHDFRRTFDTLGQDICKIAPHITDVCLNHVGEARKGVKRHYNHATYLDEKRDAMQKWADYIEALVAPKDIKKAA